MTETLLIIDALHFYAGTVVRDGRVHRAAPILRYMESRTVEWVIAYVRRKGWKLVDTNFSSIPGDAQRTRENTQGPVACAPPRL